MQALRQVLRSQNAQLIKFVIEYETKIGLDEDAPKVRFLDALISKFLTIRGSSLKTDNCNSEFATTLAKEVRRSTQTILIELSATGKDAALAIFQCMRDAICREKGQDRNVARYATAVLSLLRSAGDERSRCNVMISIGMVPALVDALQSLDLTSSQVSECSEGIMRTLEAFGSLDLTAPLTRHESPADQCASHAEIDQHRYSEMDVVDGYGDDHGRI